MAAVVGVLEVGAEASFVRLGAMSIRRERGYDRGDGEFGWDS